MATYPDATEQADEIIEHANEHQHLVIDPFVLPENVALTDLLTQAGAVSTDIFTIEAVREDGLGEAHVGRRLRTDSEASRVGIQTVGGEDPRVDIEDIHRIIWHGPLDGPPSDREVVNCRYCGEAFVNTRGNSLKPGLCIGCRTR